PPASETPNYRRNRRRDPGRRARGNPVYRPRKRQRTEIDISRASWRRDTAGRRFEAVWLVNGNANKTTSPNSKGIVDVVVRVTPNGREGGRAGCGGPGQRALLLAQANKVDEVLDLGDAVGRQCAYLLYQRLRVYGHDQPLRPVPHAMRCV